MKAILLSIICIISCQFAKSQINIDYAFSYPGIIPAEDLEISNPNSSQLDPNKIHLVILGDGYHVYDATGVDPNIEYDLTYFTQNGVSTPLLNRFYNKIPEGDYFGRVAEDYAQVLLPSNAQGDAEDVLDYIFGYDGPQPRPGLGNGNYSGYTPFKEYKHFFNTYRVLFNSENSPADLNNGVGHPKVANPSVGITCEAAGVIDQPTSSYQSYWESEFDFCDSHRALKCNYSKVQTFIDTYFPNVPVFVIVITNAGEGVYGGAANINKKTAVMTAKYHIGTGNDNYPNLEDRGTLHELAHIFGRLQDEYWFNFNSSLSCYTTLTEAGQTEAEALANYHNAPNRTDNTLTFNNENHKWHHWNLQQAEESLEYADMYVTGDIQLDHKPHLPLSNACSYCDITTNSNCYVNTPLNYFKPTHNGNCIMENVVDARPFCAVCREALVMRIYEEVDPINSYTPSDNEGIEYNLSSSQNYELNLTIPVRTDLGSGNDYKSMEVKWEILNSSEEVEYTLTVDNPNEVNLELGEFIYKLTPSGDVCGLFDELESGSYTIKAIIHDHAGMSYELTDNTRWVRHPNADHTWEVVWHVYYNGIPGTDLYAEDISDDGGIELSSGSINLWSSPDIWLCNDENSDCAQTGDAPSYDGPGAEAQINLLVKNRGCKMFDANEDHGTVTFWWAKAKTNLEWPYDWDGDEIVPSGPLEGNQIDSPVNLTEDLDISNTEGVVVSAIWAIPNPDDYAAFDLYNAEITHFCFLALVNSDNDEADMINDTDPYPLYRSVLQSNNIVWRNIAIIDDFTGGSTGQTTSTDVIRGGAVIVSNNESVPRDYKIKFEVPATETGKPITEEAEVRIILSDSLWSKWIQGGEQGSDIAIYDSTLHQILFEDTLSYISGLSLDSNTNLGMFVSFNFLTRERTSKELFTLHVTQILDDSTQRVLGGETYVIKPDPNRAYFTADAGDDKEVIIGNAYSQTAKAITDSAIYNWYNSSGVRLQTGITFSDSATTTSTETYKLEVIAKSDGYKDYDEVTISTKLGKLTSIVPNPISTGTLAIGYLVASSVSTPKIRIVNISTSAYTEHSISTGSGTLNVDFLLTQQVLTRLS